MFGVGCDRIHSYMTVIKSEFFLALNQVATERGISADDVLESIKSAVLAAYKKDYGTQTDEKVEEEEVDPGLTVEINKDSGETHILHEGKDITPPGFGRIAAQTARQVILQKIREAEKRTIVKHYVSQVGTIIKGRVIRYDGKNAYLDIGKTEGILPLEEQIRNENYVLNSTFIVYIKEIKEDQFSNSKIIVSRSEPKLVEELFKKEVPEIENGTVKVKNVVREPGERAKIAVFSDQSGVDPVGACVGQKGIRVKSVTDELGGVEKIDIIQWNKDDAMFLREALSPASIVSVELNEQTKTAKVLVTEEQAPLAIGRSGVNVNLASRLTGYIIDIIQQKSEKKPDEVEKPVQEDEKVEEQTPAEDESKAKTEVAEKVTVEETQLAQGDLPSDENESDNTVQEVIEPQEEASPSESESAAPTEKSVQTSPTEELSNESDEKVAS